jgi:hypothetical protein
MKFNTYIFSLFFALLLCLKLAYSDEYGEFDLLMPTIYANSFVEDNNKYTVNNNKTKVTIWWSIEKGEFKTSLKHFKVERNDSNAIVISGDDPVPPKEKTTRTYRITISKADINKPNVRKIDYSFADMLSPGGTKVQFLNSFEGEQTTDSVNSTAAKPLDDSKIHNDGPLETDCEKRPTKKCCPTCSIL